MFGLYLNKSLELQEVLAIPHSIGMCDLAARNVLVFDLEVLKVCDLRMAKEVNYSGYYRRTRKVRTYKSLRHSFVEMTTISLQYTYKETHAHTQICNLQQMT